MLILSVSEPAQLRPSATVYDLAKNFNLEVSMFERLVRVNFPFVRLNYQVSYYKITSPTRLHIHRCQ